MKRKVSTRKRRPTNVAFDILFDLQLEHSWFKLLPDLSVHLSLLKFSVFVPFCPFPLFRCLIVGPGLSSPACLCGHLLLHLFQLLWNLVLLLWLSVVPITQSPGVSRFGKVTLVLFSHWTSLLVSDFCRRAGLLEEVLPNAVQRPVECLREAEILPRVPYEISVHLDWRFPWRIGGGSCWWICVFKAQDQLRSLSKAPYMYLTFLLSLLVPSWIHHFLVSIVSCAKAGCVTWQLKNQVSGASGTFHWRCLCPAWNPLPGRPGNGHDTMIVGWTSVSQSHQSVHQSVARDSVSSGAQSARCVWPASARLIWFRAT